jgi:hypothetical protein
LDALLGRIAVERGLISEAQLESGLRVLGASPEGSRTLDSILKEQGVLSDRQLEDLAEERDRRMKTMAAYGEMAREELEFGQLLVKHHRATQNQVNKCLEIQQKLAGEGRQPVPKLGELLVSHGFVDAATVRDMLKLQHKNENPPAPPA